MTLEQRNIVSILRRRGRSDPLALLAADYIETLANEVARLKILLEVQS